MTDKTITIAHDDFDCKAPNDSWKHGIYLDPEWLNRLLEEFPTQENE